MKNQKVRDLNDYVVPINMNGLKGRMLRLPPPEGKKRELLLIYGHHASLERLFGVAEDLNQYGGVTMPDLPGFGGMESFYKIGSKPTLDNLADYLASFIKLRYKRGKVTIAAMSFGFVIVTRMLQRYPDLTRKVDLLISIVGFTHYEDFTFSKPRYLFYRYGAGFFSRRLSSLFFRYLILSSPVLRLGYARTHNARHKFNAQDREAAKKIMDFEIHLWHCNDVRTYMSTSVAFLTLDNCTQQIDLPVWHISVKADRYFDNRLVEQHMRIIFKDFHVVRSRMDNHAPSIVADKKTAAPLIPRKIRRILESS
jgi:pimeloyl-ACP methyl ester carboxylesterase